MSKQETTISFNTPLSIKERLQKMADDNGITISVLMRMSVMQLLSRGISIEPTFEPKDELVTAIHDAEMGMAKGELKTVKAGELAEYLGALKR